MQNKSAGHFWNFIMIRFEKLMRMDTVEDIIMMIVKNTRGGRAVANFNLWSWHWAWQSRKKFPCEFERYWHIFKLSRFCSGTCQGQWCQWKWRCCWNCKWRGPNIKIFQFSGLMMPIGLRMNSPGSSSDPSRVAFRAKINWISLIRQKNLWAWSLTYAKRPITPDLWQQHLKAATMTANAVKTPAQPWQHQRLFEKCLVFQLQVERSCG